MDWTSYKISWEIQEQMLWMQKRIQSQPRVGEGKRQETRIQQNRPTEIDTKNRQKAKVRRQKQTRKMHRSNLKCYKIWHVTCKVQWDLNGSSTVKRRIAASVASLQDEKVQHQNFIVSGFNSGFITFSFSLFAIFFPILLSFYSFLLNKKNPNNFGLDYVFHNNYFFSYDFPSFKKSYQCYISKPSINGLRNISCRCLFAVRGVLTLCSGCALFRCSNRHYKANPFANILYIKNVTSCCDIPSSSCRGQLMTHYSTRYHWIYSAHGRMTSQQK